MSPAKLFGCLLALACLCLLPWTACRAMPSHGRLARSANGSANGSVQAVSLHFCRIRNEASALYDSVGDLCHIYTSERCEEATVEGGCTCTPAAPMPTCPTATLEMVCFHFVHLLTYEKALYAVGETETLEYSQRINVTIEELHRLIERVEEVHALLGSGEVCSSQQDLGVNRSPQTLDLLRHFKSYLPIVVNSFTNVC